MLQVEPNSVRTCDCLPINRRAPMKKKLIDRGVQNSEELFVYAQAGFSELLFYGLTDWQPVILMEPTVACKNNNEVTE